MIKKYIKEILTSPIDVIKNFFLYRHILLQMVTIEIKGRFAGSMGGLLWNLIHPLLMLAVYLFVFVYIFKIRVGSEAGAGTSVIYLISGLFPWIMISEGLSRGTSSLIENANLIQKTSFPVEILPAKAVIAPLFSYGIAILILSAYKMIFTGSFAFFLLIPLIFLLQVIFTLGIAFFTATLSVFFRDVMQIMQVIINFWIYLTPILYPMDLLPGWAARLMNLNPLYPVITLYHDTFVHGRIVQGEMMFLALAWSLGLFLIGAFVFNKLKYEFADWL
jgi:lipopolysaccharide transport system permease protein